MSPESINARKCQRVRGTRSKVTTRWSAYFLLFCFQPICFSRLLTFFQPLLFYVPCPSPLTLMLPEAGSPGAGEADRQQTPGATQVQVFGSTDQVCCFSPKVNVIEEQNRDPRYCTCVSTTVTAQALNHKAL